MKKDDDIDRSVAFDRALAAAQRAEREDQAADLQRQRDTDERLVQTLRRAHRSPR